MDKPLYLGMSILDISKTLMYEFWYDYIKLKYGDRAKLCYTDTDSFVIHIITEDFFEDISDDVERWFDTSNYDENDKRPLPIGKNKKVPGLFKDELGGKLIKEICALRAKTSSYLGDDGSEIKKAKGTKTIIIKRRLMFENYKYCLFNYTIILRSQLRFKSDYHEIYTEEVNKVALSSDDDKVLQTFNRIESYPYGTPSVIVCESGRLMECEAKEKLKMLEGKIEMQTNKCESKTYAKEKEECEMFLENVEERHKKEMRKYMKLKNINNDQFR